MAVTSTRNQMNASNTPNEMEVLAWIPLNNFSCSTDSVIIESDIRIRRLRNEELRAVRAFRKKWRDDDSISSSIIIDIWLTNDGREKFNVTSEHLQDRYYTTISALRLFKEGNIGSNVALIIIKKPKNDSSIILKYMGLDHFIDNFPTNQDDYTLPVNELDSFLEFWNALKQVKLKGDNTLSEAIKRFNYAYERRYHVDKIVDLMIALESLFLRDDDRTELRYKLALRTAVFLETDYLKRKDVFSNVKKAYDIRSKIVHGSRKIQNEEVETIVNTTATYLRQAIKLLIIQNRTVEDIDDLALK